MRKGQGNINRAGKASCLGLLALGLAMTNPMGFAAFAEETPEFIGEIENNEVGADDIALFADTPSTVTISFSPSSASGSVTPVDSSNGDRAKVDVQAIVNVKNSGGYKVYVGSTSSQLKNGSNVIDSVTSATAYNNLPLNRWGYSFRKSSSSTDKTVTDSYVAMPATLRSSELHTNSNTNITDETVYFMLSFAARIGSDKPAGTYSNSVTMSVVSSPLEVVEFPSTLVNMQDMTSAICSSVTTGASKQLKDARDGKFYWVSKLADNKCWMTQNLDLDLSTSTTLTPTTSDVTANYTPARATLGDASPETYSVNSTSQYSWSLGNYRITEPTAENDCGERASLAGCAGTNNERFTPFATPTSANGDVNAHYIVGNHYQWNAATAGTGGSITISTQAQATSSICPKGWRLPTGNTSGELQALITGTIGSDVAKLTSSPYYFVRGGYVDQSTDVDGYKDGGKGGYYWSSTPYSNAGSTYALYFDGVSSVNSSYSGSRRLAYSVRCVAK